MAKFYLLILFTCLSFCVNAQEQKVTESISVSEPFQVKTIKFYPNPATTVINFEFSKPNQKDLTLQVYNFVGKKVYELANLNQKTILSLSEFYRGVYIFQLRDKSGRIIESGKFQVVK